MTPDRPSSRAIRSLVLPLAGLLLASVLGVAATVRSAPPAGAAVAMELTSGESAHLQRLNDYRAGRGLSRLQIDPVTQLRVREWAAHMSARRTLAHSPNGGADCRAASPDCRTWAENVGYATRGEAAVFDDFLRSPSHAANIRKGDVDRVGVAVFTDARGYTWVVQRFIGCGCTNDATATAANQDRAEDRAFVSALIRDFLFRSPTSTELAYFTDLLTYRVSEASVVARFAGSDEWVGALVDQLYRSTLGRSADPSGRKHWIAVYHAGSSPAAIAAQFYGSREFFQRSGGSTGAWIDQLYQQILGRKADGGGHADWMRKAERGVSHADIAFEFYQSYESRRSRVVGLYKALLGRSPDSGGLAHWSDMLRDGQDVRLAATLASSAEYRSRA